MDTNQIAEVRTLLNELRQEREQLNQMREATKDMAKELRCLRAILYARLQSAPTINVNMVRN